MYGDLEAFEDYWKKLQHFQASSDAKAHGGPCFLSAVHLTAGTGGAATAVVRDGDDTDGQAVIYMSALTSSIDVRQFNPPVYLKKGLYLDVGSNVTSILAHFLPAKRKKE